MDLQHTFTVPAPVDRAWETLLDVEGIAPCFPGATLTGVEGEEFSGLVKVKLGPVSLQYSGKGRFLEKDGERYVARLEAQGSDKRGNGTAGASVQARLEPLGAAETRVVVDTQLKITGRPAQFGRGVIQDVGGKLIEQFATCLAQRMTDAGGPEPAAGADAAAGPEAADAAGEGAGSSGGPESAAGAPAGVTGTDGARGTAGAPTSAGGGTDGASSAAGASTEVTGAVAPAGGIAAAEPSRATRPTAPRPTSVPARRAEAEPEAAELDLNAVVLPALLRRYGPPALIVLLVLVVIRLVARRR